MPAPSGTGAGRRHPARHSRHGARRHRHHHRRRDQAGKLLQPLRARARRRGRRKPGRGAGRTGATTWCRASPGRSAVRVRSRSRDSASSRQYRPTRPRSPCPARSPWRSRPRTSIYADDAEMALAFADAVNAEARDLYAAGADVVQLDEPWLQARPEPARRYRRAGDQPRARGLAGRDGAACLLRLCRRGAGQAVRLFLPAAARRLRRRCDLDRSGAAAA